MEFQPPERKHSHAQEQICEPRPTFSGRCISILDHRVYDPEYHDYHQWDNNEVVYYQRWEGETHRRHENFRRRNREEQNEYWNWRHRHERDHDRH